MHFAVERHQVLELVHSFQEELLRGLGAWASRPLFLDTEQGAYFDGHDNVKARETGSRELLDTMAKEVLRLAG